MHQDEKKRFLSFCTGSDRSPIKGLGSLKFVISRAGPDSEQCVMAAPCAPCPLPLRVGEAHEVCCAPALVPLPWAFKCRGCVAAPLPWGVGDGGGGGRRPDCSRAVLRAVGACARLARLPTSHTCYNHLLVPDYSSRSKMEDKLRKAILQSEGFGLM